MFDPFGDFATRGYLCNVAGDKKSRVVKAAEHDVFEANVDEALEFLASRNTIQYADFLSVHRRVAPR